ncbi:MAG: helix-turn-helix transcriptional regulator [Lachnospiraceae bacterium]|nr:helix-turn-helix transcriptional regulator [Lachnospiraceae bacterium]
MISPAIYQSISHDVICTHANNCADITTSFHEHDHYEIFLLLNGNINFYLEYQDFHMRKGSGLFISPDVFHCSEQLMNGTCDICSIHIRSDYFRTLNSLQTNLTKLLFSSDRPFFHFQLTEDQIEYFSKKSHELEKSLAQKSFGDDIRSECLLKELLLFLNSLPHPRQKARSSTLHMPAIITDLISYIQKNLTNDLSIEALSETFHYNGQYISRCFRETTGISLQQYIIHKRLDLAKKYLSLGYPLTQACHLSGFHDYVNFTKSFSRYVGMCPKQYQMETIRSKSFQ